MSDKGDMLDKIVDIVVDCCTLRIPSTGKMSVTREDVLGKSKDQNVVLTRCILARMITFNGYTITTASLLLGRTPHAVRNMIKQGMYLNEQSNAYRFAEAEATLRCRKLFGS